MNASTGTPEVGDAFGRALLDIVAGTPDPIIIERDDGLVGLDTLDYLEVRDERDQWALDRVRGRVLDIGAGAGRASLALQARSHQVVALDTSPGAILACRQRGVRELHAGTVEQAVADGMGGTFDSALLLGNNLGLLGSPEHAPSFLTAVGHLLRPGGVIVGTCLDPYQTDKEAHLEYHERNRRRGQMPGHLTMRVRYQRLATDWFDWLALSSAELTDLARSAGWQITDLRPGVQYAVVLERT
jgi:SAM-dependent methyltransferase